MLPRGLAGCTAGRFELRQIYGVRRERPASACRALPAPRGTGFEHIPQSRALLSQVLGPTSLQGVCVCPHPITQVGNTATTAPCTRQLHTELGDSFYIKLFQYK